jgi:hypothetical protein
MTATEIAAAEIQRAVALDIVRSMLAHETDQAGRERCARLLADLLRADKK